MTERSQEGCAWCINPLTYNREHPVCWQHVQEYRTEISALKKQIAVQQQRINDAWKENEALKVYIEEMNTEFATYGNEKVARIQKLEKALGEILKRDEYGCGCVSEDVGDSCSCDFNFMQFIAKEALGTEEK